MGTRDLTEGRGRLPEGPQGNRPSPGPAGLEAFRRAGTRLRSRGLVAGAEGNLSTFDGRVLVITRTGSRLGSLSEDDLVAGSLTGRLPGASSDLEVHRERYRSRGSGAIAHAHPRGTVPEDGGGPGSHGVYAFGATLDEAVSEAVRLAEEAP